MNIKIIYGRGGLSTTETLFNLLQDHPQGLSMREMVKQLNRPPSMLLICLKELKKRKQVQSQLEDERLVYYPVLSALEVNDCLSAK